MPITRPIIALLIGWLIPVIAGTVIGMADSKGIAESIENALCLSFLGGVVGPYVGLTSSDAYFTWGFKLGLSVVLAITLAMYVFGVSGQARWWKWPLAVSGVILWIFVGLMGCGPV